MAALLFPGRHLLHTRFQETYLTKQLQMPLEEIGLGSVMSMGTIDRVVFAITSANQSHSRYNPVALEARAIGVDRFARRLRDSLRIDYQIVPIPHFPPTARFAEIVLKEVCEATEQRMRLTSRDTIVLGTPTTGGVR